MPYLFLHFREKSTPDGEQVYFGVSPDGFRWESLNGGAPLLWSYRGRLGTRDHAGIRTDDGFVILSTDLSLSYHIRGDRGGEISGRPFPAAAPLPFQMDDPRPCKFLKRPSSK